MGPSKIEKLLFRGYPSMNQTKNFKRLAAAALTGGVLVMSP